VERAGNAGDDHLRAVGLAWLARAQVRAEETPGDDGAGAPAGLVLAPAPAEHIPALLDEAVALADKSGNPSTRAWNRIARSQLTAQIDPVRSVEDLREAIRVAELGRSTTTLNLARAVLARQLAQLGSPLDALEVVRVSITHFRQAGTVTYLWNSVASAAVALAALGELEAATRLLGAVLAHEFELWPSADFARGRIEVEAELRGRLGRRFEALAAAGAGLTAAEAADLARQEADAALARDASG
jgi:hypothetical protein